jgi:1,4-alpha-glucan branching enzyme
VINKTDVARICNGEHHDPFSVLGLHVSAQEQQSIRAYLPGALSVEAIRCGSGEVIAKLNQVHGTSFFYADLEALLKEPYQFNVSWGQGTTSVIHDPYRFPAILSELDVWLLKEGTHLRPYEVLGANQATIEGVTGIRFAVWAPNASRVSVVGNFNAWNGSQHPMRCRPECGVWELFLPDLPLGTTYKYEIRTQSGEVLQGRADPYARQSELRPATASIVAPMPLRVAANPIRGKANSLSAPISIYEVHLASWRRVSGSPPGDALNGRWLNWDELAKTLIPYATDMGFTHLELLPIQEHPFDGSWGYQPIGLYSPTSRFGSAEGLTRFITQCHEAGLGVFLDWVPAHFPSDAHGLANFDGTHLYEYADPKEGFHTDWNTLIYNFGRTEVRNFLIGNSLYWLERFGIDGLRVDAVSSMLYRDYSREPGEWIPNSFGGRENLEAISFFKRMNEVIGSERPEATTLAEESTAYPAVSRPTYAGGLGFHFKWNMGWMHDTLAFISRDPIHRKHHHNELTFGMAYAYNENFVLPISHDEVVHGKGSLLSKMPGDTWQKFANLRAYLGFMFAHPGKKLLFMGCEFGQVNEWNHDRSLDWHLLDQPLHQGTQRLVRDLNNFYRTTPALYSQDFVPEGFEWIELNDAERSIISFIRKDVAQSDQKCIVVICNFTPTPHVGYRLGVPREGTYHERINTDSSHYGGSNLGTPFGTATAKPIAWQGKPHSIVLNLPPLATVMLEWTL